MGIFLCGIATMDVAILLEVIVVILLEVTGKTETTYQGM